MDIHVKIVGWIWIILSALGLLVMCCSMILAVFIGTSAQGDENAMMFLGIALVVLVALAIFICIPGLVAGVGILQYQSWGRMAGIAVAVLSLCNIPLGTAMGGYTLWVLFNEEVVNMFDHGGSIDDIIYT